jgi:hypothetical protein
MPAALVKDETATLVPGVNVFVPWKVTTPEEMENEVIAAGKLHCPVHAPAGATMSVTN